MVQVVTSPTMSPHNRAGDPTVASTLQTEIKQLLIRAWRERWTEITFGKQIKQLLPRGKSGDVYYLSDCILKEATSGPMPNSLFLSYLNQCLLGNAVSIGEVILAITRLRDLKPQCIESLLEFVNMFKHKITSNVSESECLVLARSLIAYLRWLYLIIQRSIKEILEGTSQTNYSMALAYGFATSQDSKVINPNEELYLCVIRRIAESIRCLAESPFLKSMLYIGKLENPSTWNEWWNIFDDIQPKLMLLADKFESKQQGEPSSNHESPLKIITNFKQSVDWIQHSIDPNRFLSNSPVISVAYEQLVSDFFNRPYRLLVNRSIRLAVSFAAILDLANRNELLANQLASIGQCFDLTLVEIYFEVLHVTLVSLIEDFKTNVNCTHFNWAAFLLFKLPSTFQCLSKHRIKLRAHQYSQVDGRNELEIALDRILQFTPVLDLFLQAYTSAPLTRLLKDFEKLELISSEQSSRLAQSIARQASQQQQQCQSTIERSSLSMVTKIDPQFCAMTILSLGEQGGNDSREQLMERRIGILCKMQKQLELYLSLIATNLMIPSFSQQLESFMQQSQQACASESEQSAQYRAIMFDVSCLYLVNIVQRHGLEAVSQTSSHGESFFVRWARWNLPQQENLQSPEAILASYGDRTLAAAEKLKTVFILKQEWPTIGANWDEMLVAAQLAIQDVCVAWLQDLIDEAQLEEIVERFRGTLCSMSVAAATWVLAQLKVVGQSERKNGEKKNDSMQKLVKLLELLTTPSNREKSTEGGAESAMEDGTDVLGLYYRERSQLMVAAVAKLFRKILPNESGASSGQPSLPSIAMSKTNLDKQLESLLGSKRPGSGMNWTEVHELHELLKVGGVAWFVVRVVRHYFFQIDPPTPEAVDFVYGLFHLDLEQAACVLLREVLPEYILYKKHFAELTEPRVSRLVRLVVITVAGARVQADTFRKAKMEQRCGHRQAYERLSFANLETSDNLEGWKKNEEKGIEAMEVDDVEDACDPVRIELVKFFFLLDKLVCLEFHPRLLVPQAWIEQCLLCLREDSCLLILRFMPISLIQTMLRHSLDAFTYERVLACFSLEDVNTRQTAAKMLCTFDRLKRIASSCDTAS